MLLTNAALMITGTSHLLITVKRSEKHQPLTAVGVYCTAATTTATHAS